VRFAITTLLIFFAVKNGVLNYQGCKQITYKNILRVDDWKKANQGCTEYNSRKYDHYLKLNMEAIGPIDEVGEKRDFAKIIRRVAETTAIDKKYCQ